MKHIAILGSTGSIGTQALDVIRWHPDEYAAEVLCAGSNVELLIKQALEFKPNAVVIADETKYNTLRDALSNEDIKTYLLLQSYALLYLAFDKGLIVCF